MSRTIRALPFRFLRHPRGRRAALLRGDRAIPPDPWDDIAFGHDVMLPWTVAWRMAGDIEGTVRVLRHKFRVPAWRALEMARYVARRRRIERFAG